MRLLCFGCEKSVSSEVPDDTIIRAASFCPECIEVMGEHFEVALKRLIGRREAVPFWVVSKEKP